MTAVRTVLVSWALIAWNSLGLFFTWLMAKVKDPKPAPKKRVPISVSPPQTAADVPVARPPRPPALVVTSPPCEVCGDPSTGVRTHDGHWRCARHKAVTCDVCGRAPVVRPVDQLRDQAWTCATHG